MSLFFDSYIDTKEKRYHLVRLVTLIACTLIIVPYILLSLSLLSLASYESLYALLAQPIVEYTYVSRIILHAISKVTFTLGEIVYLFFSTIRWYEGLTLLCILFNIPNILHKKMTLMILLLILAEIAGITLFVYIGIRATTLLGALNALRVIGGIVGVINSILLIVFIYLIKRQVVAYKNALQYCVVEIKEHTT